MLSVRRRPCAAASSPMTPDFVGSRRVARVVNRLESPQDCKGPASRNSRTVTIALAGR